MSELLFLFKFPFQSYTDLGLNMGSDLAISLYMAEFPTVTEEIGVVKVLTTAVVKPNPVPCIVAAGFDARTKTWNHWAKGQPGQQLAIASVARGRTKPQLSEKEAKVTDEKGIEKSAFWYLHSTDSDKTGPPEDDDGCFWYRLHVPAARIMDFRKKNPQCGATAKVNVAMKLKFLAKKAPSQQGTTKKIPREIIIPLYAENVRSSSLAGARV